MPPNRDDTLRRRLHRALDPTARDGEGLSTINRTLVGLILAATLLGVIETEPSVQARFGVWLEGMELCLGAIFLVEYAARLWVAPEHQGDENPWVKRLRFVISPPGVTDVVAVIASLVPVVGPSALMLRLVRLLRILRLAKLGRMSKAMHNIARAVAARQDELFLSLLAGLVIMLVSATALHLVEGSVQPEAFGSIPRALWWAVATLTTIGYGDVYPVTPLGKILAACTAISSIGVIAMPAGILAAAFSDAVQHGRTPEDHPGT